MERNFVGQAARALGCGGLVAIVVLAARECSLQSTIGAINDAGGTVSVQVSYPGSGSGDVDLHVPPHAAPSDEVVAEQIRRVARLGRRATSLRLDGTEAGPKALAALADASNLEELHVTSTPYGRLEIALIAGRMPWLRRLYVTDGLLTEDERRRLEAASPGLRVLEASPRPRAVAP
jgi:hypothetical protein